MSQPQDNGQLMGMEPPAEKAREMAQLAQAVAAGISAYRGRQMRKSVASQQVIQQLDAQATAEAQPRPLSSQEFDEVKGMIRQADQNQTSGRWARHQYRGPELDDYAVLGGGVPGMTEPVSVVVPTENQAEALVAGIKDPAVLSDADVRRMQGTVEPVQPDRRERRDRDRARTDAAYLAGVTDELDQNNALDRALLDGLEQKAQNESNVSLAEAVQRRRQAWHSRERQQQGQQVSMVDLAPTEVRVSGPETPAAPEVPVATGSQEPVGDTSAPETDPSPEAGVVPGLADPEAASTTAAQPGEVPPAQQTASAAGPGPEQDGAQSGVRSKPRVEFVSEEQRIQELTQRYPRQDPWETGQFRVDGDVVAQEELARLIPELEPTVAQDCDTAAKLWDAVDEHAQEELAQRFEGLREAMELQAAQPVAEAGLNAHDQQVATAQSQAGRQARHATVASGLVPTQAAQATAAQQQASGGTQTSTPQQQTTPAAQKQQSSKQAPQR